MEGVQQITSYISQQYEKEYGRQIDEMKLHKLPYLTQREAVIETGEPLFGDRFEVWKYGLVLYSVHKTFQTDKLHGGILSEETVGKYKKVFGKVSSSYAPENS